MHGLAERVGSTPFPMYAEDERRYWIALLKAMGKMIPCPTCKEHYAAYTKENPFEAPLKALSYYDMNTWIRTYLWDLHNWVNQSNGKAEFPFEDISVLYNNVNLRAALKELRQPVELAIQLSGTQIVGFQEFSKHLSMLFSVYGV